MTIKNYIFSEKRRFGLIISLVIIVIGIIPLLIFTFYADPVNPYTINQVTLVSGDSTEITALIYTPNNKTGKHPGIVVAHGFCGSKQFMNELSIELVKRQFVVVNIDFRGHGSSGGYLPSLHREDSDELVGDVMAAVYYLRNLSYVGDQIGLVGHSMGGRTVSQLAWENSGKFNATVSIGMIPELKNITKIKNLMIALGQFEEIFTQSMGLDFLKNYTAHSDVVINQLYGNFSQGNASKVVIGIGNEHLFEPQNPIIIYETVNWFELAFYGTIRWPITNTSIFHSIFYCITIFGVVTFGFVIVVYLKNYLWKDKPYYLRKDMVKDQSVIKLAFGYIVCELVGLISLLLLSRVFSDVLPVSLGNTLYAEAFGNAIGIILITYFLILRREKKGLKDFPSKLNELTSRNWGLSSILGISMAIIMALTLTSVSHWSNSPIFLTQREIGAIIGMTILFFPFILIKEFYFRTIQSKIKTKSPISEYFKMLGIGVAIDNILIIPIMLLTWGNPNSTISFLALALFVFLLFSIIQQIVVTWIYMYSGRNIIGSSLFLSIFYSWMIVNFFPFGLAMNLI
ncbi:MAG: alpha/beta hydrolase [Candidatus Helarchaeota archaeon]